METFTGTGTSVKKLNLMLKKEEQHIEYMVVALWVQLIDQEILVPLETLVVLSY